MRRVVRLVLLVLGIGIAAVLISRHSGAIAESLSRVGPGGLALYLLASFTAYALDAVAWRMVFQKEQQPVPFWRLFSIRMAGEAVNKVTPLASMGGEPLKAFLLTRHGSTLTDALASVAIAKNAITIAQIAFIFGTVALALRLWPRQDGVLLSIAIFPALILLAMIVTAILDLRLRRKRRKQAGADGEPEDASLSRWRRAALAGRRAAVEMWAQVADYYWANPGRSALAIWVFFLGWAAGALELLAGSYALGVPLSIQDALALEGLLVGVNMATFFIPANAGSQESGYAFLAPLMGLATGHGVALAVLRRCRDAAWVGFGLAYLALTEGRVLFELREERREVRAEG